MDPNRGHVSVEGTVVECLGVLYSPVSSADDRSRADKYLTEFQASQLAWQACRNLLLQDQYSSNLHAAYFGATTLHMKCRQHIEELGIEDKKDLCSSILQFLFKCKVFSVRRRACLAHVSLCTSIYISDRSVGLSFETLWALLEEAVALDGASGSNANAINVAQTFVIWLGVAFDDTLNCPATSTNHVPWLNYMGSKSKQVVQLLSQCFLQNWVEKTQIFECLNTWVLNGKINPMDLASTPLLSASFSPGTYELMETIIYKFYQSPDQSVAQHILKSVSELHHSLVQGSISKRNENHKIQCFLASAFFSIMGSSGWARKASLDDLQGLEQQVSARMVHFFYRCLTGSFVDGTGGRASTTTTTLNYKLCSLALSFWEEFGDKPVVVQSRQFRPEQFLQSLHAACMLSHKERLSSYNDAEEDEVEHFEEFRAHARLATLMLAFTWPGMDYNIVLNIMLQILQVSSSWEHAESAIWLLYELDDAINVQDEDEFEEKSPPNLLDDTDESAIIGEGWPQLYAIISSLAKLERAEEPINPRLLMSIAQLTERTAASIVPHLRHTTVKSLVSLVMRGLWDPVSNFASVKALQRLVGEGQTVVKLLIQFNSPNNVLQHEMNTFLSKNHLMRDNLELYKPCISAFASIVKWCPSETLMLDSLTRLLQDPFETLLSLGTQDPASPLLKSQLINQLEIVYCVMSSLPFSPDEIENDGLRKPERTQAYASALDQIVNTTHTALQGLSSGTFYNIAGEQFRNKVERLGISISVCSINASGGMFLSLQSLPLVFDSFESNNIVEGWLSLLHILSGQLHREHGAPENKLVMGLYERLGQSMIRLSKHLSSWNPNQVMETWKEAKLMLWPSIVFSTIEEPDEPADRAPWNFYMNSIPVAEAGMAIISSANVSVTLVVATVQSAEQQGRRASQRDAKRLTKMLHKFVLYFVERFASNLGAQQSSNLLLQVVGGSFHELLNPSVYGSTSTLVQNAIAGMILDFVYNSNELLRSVSRQCADAVALFGTPNFDYSSLLKGGQIGPDVRRQLVKALRRREC